MPASAVSHKSSRSVYGASLQQLVLEEFQGLRQSKDTLDMDFPAYAKHVTNRDLWKIAYIKLMNRLCDPGYGECDFN